mmetsp:Transcript_99434/g.256998  ORF Transcript_99434/g.256998 Transcript_99434/m.256998 type:complete len:343 (+) Transcript_99434:194-1222(+)
MCRHRRMLRKALATSPWRASQKVVGHALRAALWRDLLLHGRRVELQERVLEVLVDLHDGGLVAAAVTVIRCGEDRDDVPVMAPVVALHHKLVRTSDQLQAIRVVELFRDVLAEGVACAARRDAPAAAVVGVGPEQVAHGPLVGHFLDSVELADVVEGVEGGRDATVHADDLVLDHRRHGQVVEGVREELPDLGSAVRPHTLVEEAVDLGDLPALVVPAQQRDALLIADLLKEHRRHGLHRIVAAVHVVSEEEVVRLRQRPADAKELLQVQELPVDVAAHRDGAADGLAVGLLLEDLAHLLAQGLALGLRELTFVLHVLDLLLEVRIQQRLIGRRHGGRLSVG